MMLISTLLIAILPTDAEGAIYEDTVRLHILANSDCEEDQTIKLLLRDEILSEYGEKLSIFESTEDAKFNLSQKTDEIKEFADRKLSEHGCEFKTEVYLLREWYDTREYEDFSLPCGYYTSLKIVIGNGEGQNWWCVMFPPLCLDASTSSPKYTAEEEILISKKYKIKFKILELVSEITR